jgi:hypothetical protein
MSTAPSTPAVLPRSKPELRNAMSLFGRELLAALAAAQSGTIQAFYPATQTADVAFTGAIVVGYETDASGQTNPVTRPYPLLASVPVVFLGGAGAALTFPVAAGDTCLLVFLDRDSDVWLTTGQTGMPPNSNRLHSLSDAVAIVGLRSAPGALSTVSTTDVQLYGKDGPTGPLISIAPTGAGKIGIGNNTGQLVTALDNLSISLDALALALTTWVDTHGDSPNAGTIANINAAKAEWDAARAEWDAILK